MHTLKSIFLWSILMGLGCGPKPPPVGGEGAVRHDPIPGNHSAPTKEQIAAARNGNLSCEFEGECEPALALVSVALSDGLNRCTGFLISDHEVMTNDHCLDSMPEAVTGNGIIFIHLTGNVHRGVKKISVRSHQSGINSKDYAVLVLDEPITDRRPLNLSHRGFDDGETATIFSMQATRHPVHHTYDGQQVKQICQANYPTLIHINILSAQEALMTFGDCPIQKGYSGSPLINRDGEVGAVVQGTLSIEGDEFSESLKPYLLDENYGQVGLGTQVHCMSEWMGKSADSCSEIKPLSALDPESYLTRYGQFSDATLPVLPHNQKWTEYPKALKNEKKFFSSPDCIPAEALRSRSFSFESKVLSYRQGINSRFRAEWRLHKQQNSVFSANNDQDIFQQLSVCP